MSICHGLVGHRGVKLSVKYLALHLIGLESGFDSAVQGPIRGPHTSTVGNILILLHAIEAKCRFVFMGGVLL
jgi:hypothetical protein